MFAALLLAARLADPSGAALAGAAPGAAPSASASAPEAAPSLRHYTLKNGLDVVLEVDRRAPYCAVVVTYDVGTRDGPADRRQLPHVVEHLMFEGSRHVSRGRRDDVLFQAAATHINASTEFDQTHYYTIVPPQALATVIWLEAERMGFLRGHHEEATLAPARNAVLHELRQRRDGDDLSRLFIRTYDALYPPGDPYHGLIDASLGGADKVTLWEVNRFLRRRYGPQSATLAIYGDLPPETEAAIERFFGPLRAGRPPPPAPEAGPPLAAEVVLRERSPLDAPVVVMAWRTPPLHTDGDAAADVLVRILTHASQSGLLRGDDGEPGAIVRIEAQHASRHLGGALVVIAQGRPAGDVEAVRAGVDGILTRLAEGRIDPTLISSAAREVEVSQRAAMESSINRAATRASYLATVGTVDWLEEDLTRSRRVDAAAIQGLMREVVRRDRRVVVLAAPAEAGS